MIFSAVFKTNFLCYRSSIFDNKTHKFGNLLVVKNNGEQVNVFNEIVNSDFGYEDEFLFLQDLRDNNLNTELKCITLQEVMKKLEEAYISRGIPKNTWLNALKNNNPVMYENKHVVLEDKYDNFDTVLKNKLDILKFCQDIDDVSLGRGCQKNTSKSSCSSSMALRKKMECLKFKGIVNLPKHGKPDTENSENQSPNRNDGKTCEIDPDMKQDEKNNNLNGSDYYNNNSTEGIFSTYKAYIHLPVCTKV